MGGMDDERQSTLNALIAANVKKEVAEELLIIIEKKVGDRAYDVYEQLQLLVKSVKDGKADISVLDKELLIAIAEEEVKAGQWHWISGAYLHLRMLAEEVRSGNADARILNKDLFIAVAKAKKVHSGKEHIFQVYIELRKLAKTMKSWKADADIPGIETLLIAIAENAGENTISVYAKLSELIKAVKNDNCEKGRGEYTCCLCCAARTREKGCSKEK
jgi:hypothetical protein